MTWRRRVGVLIALLSFLLLSAAALLSSCDGRFVSGLSGIESDLTSSTSSRLAQAGLNGTVNVDGRDVTVVLNEPLPDGWTEAQLRAELLREAGVRSASFEIPVADVEFDEVATDPTPAPTSEPDPEPAAADPVELIAVIENGSVWMSGVLNTGNQFDDLVGGASIGFGNVDTTAIDVADVPAGAAGLDENDAHVTGFGDVLASVGPRITSGEAQLKDGRLALRGNVADDATRTAVLDEISVLGADYGLGLDLDLAVAGSSVSDAVSEIDLSDVNFTSGTAELTAEAQTTLDLAAPELIALGDAQIEVQGHTDSTGDPGLNLTLSQARAEAVVAYLVEQGVSANNLTPRGYGADEPIADNSTAEGQAANRRVVLVVVEGN